jgi:hypothetical protein
MTDIGQTGGDPSQHHDRPQNDEPGQEHGTYRPPTDEPPRRKPPGYGDKGGEDPCANRDCGDPTDTPESGCKCKGGCTCECTMDLPEGTIRRILETLRNEVKAPPACTGSPATAKTDFGKALDDSETEYQNIGSIEQAYRDYHCQIDCELDKAESQCQDMKVWCEQVTASEKKCIETLWLCCYEQRERRLRCECWIRKNGEYEHLHDCLEQAKSREARALEDFKAVKEFQTTLKSRFEELKKLWEEAKKKFDKKQYLAVYAILIEYRNIYHNLGRLVLWKSLPDVTPAAITWGLYCDEKASLPPANCDRPDFKPYNAKWLRKALMAALRNLIRARYHRFCWHQHWIDTKHCAERCKADLDEFRGSRRDKFILEAQDCGGEEEEEEEEEQENGKEYEQEQQQQQRPTQQHPSEQQSAR